MRRSEGVWGREQGWDKGEGGADEEEVSLKYWMMSWKRQWDGVWKYQQWETGAEEPLSCFGFLSVKDVAPNKNTSLGTGRLLLFHIAAFLDHLTWLDFEYWIICLLLYAYKAHRPIVSLSEGGNRKLLATYGKPHDLSSLTGISNTTPVTLWQPAHHRPHVGISEEELVGMEHAVSRGGQRVEIVT